MGGIWVFTCADATLSWGIVIPKLFGARLGAGWRPRPTDWPVAAFDEQVFLNRVERLCGVVSFAHGIALLFVIAFTLWLDQQPAQWGFALCLVALSFCMFVAHIRIRTLRPVRYVPATLKQVSYLLLALALFGRWLFGMAEGPHQGPQV